MQREEPFMTKTGLLLGAALALTVTAASAADTRGTNYDVIAGDNFSANDVLPGCRNFIDHKWSVEPFIQGVCVGIVLGIMDSGTTVQLIYPPPSLRDDNRRNPYWLSLCVDTIVDVTLEQAVRAVVAYSDASPRPPERKNMLFHYFALEALRAAWPCK
jgi:hypothetical protein